MTRSPLRPEHWEKELFPMLVRELGNANCPAALKPTRLLHALKASFPTSIRSDMLTLVRFAHAPKTLFPRVVTSGISILVRLEHT